MYPIIDMHCDVLSKLLDNPKINFYDEQCGMDVCFPYLQRSQIYLQTFAIYLSDQKGESTFNQVVQCVQLLHQKVLCHPDMVLIKSRADLDALGSNGKIGALLTLEGADALAGNLGYLPILRELGVRCLGITWNYANWAADGVLETRNAGLTLKGKRLIEECEHWGILIDVSHLNEKGFWELTEMATTPFFASHSNAYHICPHPRNLKDEQISALIKQRGMIGITFVPYFVKSIQPVNISDIITHIDHICALGGAQHIGFGSDFDGIETWINGLEHAGKYEGLVNELLKHFTDQQVKGFLHHNFNRFLQENL